MVDHYSVSSITKFDYCPARYKAEYLEGMKGGKNLAMLYGSLVHEAIEKVNVKTPVNGMLDPEDVRTIWNEVYTEEKDRKTALDVFSFDSYQMGLNGLLKYAERFVEVSALISAEQLLEIDFKGRKIQARLDIAEILPSGDLRVIDAKSGGKIPSREEVSADFQLAVYAVVLRQMFPDLQKYPKIIAGYYSFGAGVLVSVEKTEQSIIDASDYLEVCLKRMEEEKEYRDKINNRCNDCPIKINCKSYMEFVSQQAGEIAYVDLISGDPQALVKEYEKAKSYASLSEKRQDAIKLLLEAEVTANGPLAVEDGVYKLIDTHKNPYSVQASDYTSLKKIKGVSKPADKKTDKKGEKKDEEAKPEGKPAEGPGTEKRKRGRPKKQEAKNEGAQPLL